MKPTYSTEDLVNLERRHEALVGIDSDGCVFDTMEVKQKDFFHPEIVRHWGLEVMEPQLREAAEFVNMHSAWRGLNRFPNLLKTFELLEAWPDAVATGAELPNLEPLRAYVHSGLPLGMPTLRAEVERTADPELQRIYAWSETVNRRITEEMKEIPPFPGVRPCLQKMRQHADLLVVSQTPEATLVNEWNLHGLHEYVDVIAGQELGTKAIHLELAMGQTYTGDRVLMMGDALGDRDAAREVGACFYPVLPGEENRSWQRLNEEAFDRFLQGTYRGRYEQQLVATFEALLPETPPWA